MTAPDVTAIQVITSLGSREHADRIATALVERRLAACVQVSGPVTSTYRWKGAVESTPEWVCVIKTDADRYSEVEAAVLEFHPYELPELLAFPVTTGLAGYLRWIADETRR
ncbi:MAG: divalent-cation tolerance protein CutA [Gemmatimonadota bacterium]